MHSKPLNEALAAAETQPRQPEAPEWQKAAKLPRKTTRKTVMEPLEWTPPENS